MDGPQAQPNTDLVDRAAGARRPRPHNTRLLLENGDTQQHARLKADKPKLHLSQALATKSLPELHTGLDELPLTDKTQDRHGVEQQQAIARGNTAGARLRTRRATPPQAHKTSHKKPLDPKQNAPPP